MVFGFFGQFYNLFKNAIGALQNPHITQGFLQFLLVLRGGLDTSVGRFTGMSALYWELCQCLVGDIKQLLGLMTR